MTNGRAYKKVEPVIGNHVSPNKQRHKTIESRGPSASTNAKGDKASRCPRTTLAHHIFLPFILLINVNLLYLMENKSVELWLTMILLSAFTYFSCFLLISADAKRNEIAINWFAWLGLIVLTPLFLSVYLIRQYGVLISTLIMCAFIGMTLVAQQVAVVLTLRVPQLFY